MASSKQDSFLAVIDISVLGTALIYRAHHTGVHRATMELLRQFSLRPEVRLEFVSVGRAAWLEFASYIAFERLLKKAGWVFRRRSAKMPFFYSLSLSLVSIAIRAKDKGWMSEQCLAGFMQCLGKGLNPQVATFSAFTYYSPAHALPNLPRKVKRCITINDMIPLKFPNWYTEVNSFEKIVKSIDSEQDWIIAISESSRRDWLEYSNGSRERSKVISCGVAEYFFPRRDTSALNAIRQKYGVGQSRFVLAVGTLEPRKNLEVLIQAFMSLKEKKPFHDVQLLVVGPKGWKNEGIFRLLQSDNDLKSDVRLAGFVPDEDLPFLYSACEVFVFPSLYEGFGLPVAEALRCGAAVICGNHSSLPEVAADAAEYVDVTKAEELEAAMAKLLSDSKRVLELREKAQRRCVGLCWKQAADGYLKLFRSFVNSKAE